MVRPRIPRLIVIGTAVAALGAVAVLAMAVASVMFFGAQRSQSSALAALEASKVDAATLPRIVPFRDIAGHIVVDALLGDSEEPFALILDSGAPTTISLDVADGVGGDDAGEIQQVSIDGTVVRSDVVRVGGLRLGDAVFGDVGAVRGFISRDDPLSCASENGLIGASLMKEAAWQIDYDANEVTIAPSIDGLDHIDGAIRLDFTSDTPASPSPVVEIPVGDGKLRLLVDTGSNGWLAMNPRDLAGTGTDLDPDGPAYQLLGSGAAGTFSDRVAWAAADVRLGEVRLNALPVATLETLAPGLGSIGNAFLRNYVVTIDWPGRAVYLDPVTSDAVMDDPRPPVPASLTLGWSGEDVIVGSFVEGSAADEAGVALGLPVLALDGRDLSGATREDFCELYAAGQDETSSRRESFELTVAGGRTVRVGPVDDFFGPVDDFIPDPDAGLAADAVDG